MKKLFFVLIAIIISNAANATFEKITLEQAIKNKWVKANIAGKGGHCGKCIKFKIQNLTTRSFNINIETGRKLICDFDSVQNMMVTQAEMLSLAPYGKSEIDVNAMCIQKKHRSPSSTSFYKPGELATGNLFQLAKLLELNKYQDYVGQRAVWVLTDKAELADVKGSNEDQNKKLQDFLMNALKMAKLDDNVPKLSDHMDEYYISGVVTFELTKQENGSIQVFDKNGNMISVLCDNEPFNEGYNKYDFRLVNPAIKKDNTYFVRLTINGNKIKEISMPSQIN